MSTALVCETCGKGFVPKWPKRDRAPRFCSLKCFGASLRAKIADRTEKKCSRCGVVKPLDQFFREQRKADGRTAICKTCRYEHRKMTEQGQASEIKYRRSERGKRTARNSTVTLRAKPGRYAAHIAVQCAVLAGHLLRGPCEVCGSLRVQAHHDNYEKPLEVRWLCAKHHMELHARERGGSQ